MEPSRAEATNLPSQERLTEPRRVIPTISIQVTQDMGPAARSDFQGERLTRKLVLKPQLNPLASEPDACYSRAVQIWGAVMAKYLLVFGLVLAIGAGSAGDLFGCGDKFLSAARGTRFQQAPRGQQETILVYAHPASDVPAAVARVSTESLLHGAGYRPTIVTSAADLERELSEGSWDLVLAGLSDAESISGRLLNNGGVLPVVLQGAKEQLKAAQVKYPVVLTKAPNGQGLIRAISQALASRTSVKSD